MYHMIRMNIDVQKEKIRQSDIVFVVDGDDGYVGKSTMNQIAYSKLLNKPLSTILSKYNRAIKKLKQIVKEENYEKESN